MDTTRRQYTAEFKRDAVALVMEQGYAISVAAQNLGIAPKILSRWKGEHQQHRDAAFPGQGHQTPEQAELRQLREDNRRLRMERDILKKATAFFARHST
jgi:transposase